MMRFANLSPREFFDVFDALRQRVDYSEGQLEIILDTYATPDADPHGEEIDSEMTIGLMELYNAMYPAIM